MAFVNRCPHVNLELDMEVQTLFLNTVSHEPPNASQDGRMFSRDGQLLQCKVHGALFHVSSGEGLGGPCRNQALTRLEVILEEGNVIFTGSVLPRVPEEDRPKMAPRRHRRQRGDEGEAYFESISNDLEKKVAEADARLASLARNREQDAAGSSRAREETSANDEDGSPVYTAWKPPSHFVVSKKPSG